jgi:hypothetical protein
MTRGAGQAEDAPTADSQPRDRTGAYDAQAGQLDRQDADRGERHAGLQLDEHAPQGAHDAHRSAPQRPAAGA